MRSLTTGSSGPPTGRMPALRIGRDDVLEALGGLPEGNLHCAQQAAHLLREALRDYQAIRQTPWKKTYQRY